jgi:hypothetical protein
MNTRRQLESRGTQLPPLLELAGDVHEDIQAVLTLTLSDATNHPSPPGRAET